jgi:hypothetical protein
MMTSIAANNDSAIIAARPQAVQLVPNGAPVAPSAKSEGVSFSDVLDAVNPLQHIPVVSSVYRAATGSSISAIAQIAGGALFGGLAGGVISGVVASVADVAVKEISGKNVAEHVVATLNDAVSSESPKNGVALIAMEGQNFSTGNEKQVALNDQARDAATLILRNDINAEKVAGQYQRAQTLDVANKLLVANL